MTRRVEVTNPRHVHIVIVRQRVQHLHHGCLDQFERQSTDTAAPGGGGGTQECEAQQQGDAYTLWIT